jgi:hypothetical protein
VQVLILKGAVITLSLFIFANNVSAANSGANKNNAKKKAHDTEKTLNHSDNIWDRVRLGMKMPWSTLATQTPVKPVPTLEKNNLNDSSTPKRVTSNTQEETAPENNKPPEQLVAAKYINPPYTAVAPVNNYTELGYRIRFGTDRKPQDSESTESAPDSQLAKVKEEQVVSHNKAKEEKNPKKSVIDERIGKYIAMFSQNPVYLYQVTERARPYLYSIVEELSKKQLPLELALLPIVESAYQPTIQSPKGAAGLWQFMPATGNDYGLKQSEQFDDRLDTLASTRAAVRFLSDLKNHFKGDWLLALAAYNCGQGAVDNAISRNLKEGMSTDFWSLRLPKETQEYVPRLLALSNIFANPENYGIKFAPIKNEPYLIKAKTGNNQA